MEIRLKLEVFLFLYLSSFFFIQRQTIVDPYNNFDFLKRVFLETISHKKYDLEMLNGPGKLLVMEKVFCIHSSLYYICMYTHTRTRSVNSEMYYYLRYLTHRWICKFSREGEG